MTVNYEVAVRSVPQGYKGGAVPQGEPVHPWNLCPHFHRTEAGARSCGEKDLRRLIQSLRRLESKSSPSARNRK